MREDRIQNFRTITELQKSLENDINALKSRSDKFSKLIGEKLRVTDSANAEELQEFRQKIDGSTTDPKKKKSVKKKDQKNNWHNLDAISIYDGIGIKGELELYFKAAEQAKAGLERITKIKQTVDDLINKGLKRELGCVMFINEELPAEIAFTKPIISKKKFVYKAIFNVQKEEVDEIKI
ncbi:MAG: hypothetical protein ACREBI_04490 [Nitrosotalea sp.]